MIAPEVTSGADVARLWSEENPLSHDEEAERRADAAYGWLLELIDSPDAVVRLIPEAAGLDIEVHPLPRLRALNVVIRGVLGRGVSENTLLDPQAKGLGEYLRARVVDVPTAVLGRP